MGPFAHLQTSSAAAPEVLAVSDAERILGALSGALLENARLCPNRRRRDR